MVQKTSRSILSLIFAAALAVALALALPPAPVDAHTVSYHCHHNTAIHDKTPWWYPTAAHSSHGTGSGHTEHRHYSWHGQDVNSWVYSHSSWSHSC